MSKLDGAGDLGAHILGFVKKKEVLSTSSPSPSAPSADPAEKSNEGGKANGTGTS